jgi:tRNA(Phe) wybutosine-synthesizing methylase Tyw3
MNDHEINRAVQYVTASTCYGRETVATILKTGFGELTDLAVQSTRMDDQTDRTARTVGPRGLELCRTVAR